MQFRISLGNLIRDSAHNRFLGAPKDLRATRKFSSRTSSTNWLFVAYASSQSPPRVFAFAFAFAFALGF